MERLGFENKESMRSLIDQEFCEMRKPVVVRPAFFIPKADFSISRKISAQLFSSVLPPENDSRFSEKVSNCGSKGATMGRQKHTAEQVINKLQEAEVLIGKATSMEEFKK